MPYLQLDVANHYPVDVKRDLARRLGNIFARAMQTTPDMVTVAFRELGEGGVWRCNAGEPEPAALLSCDIRCESPARTTGRARPGADRGLSLGLRRDRVGVEFTQHTSDEMYRHGRGWAAEWTPAEAMRFGEAVKQAAQSSRQRGPQ
jgi:phenylpyruvate tautomerase PptA (4-oxalocrotonate tautomerase family)